MKNENSFTYLHVAWKIGILTKNTKYSHFHFKYTNHNNYVVESAEI